MGMHPTQTEAETDDRIDHRVPNLARDGAAVIPEPAATLGTAMLGNVAVTDCMEHGHIPRLGNEVCGQTADDENPVLPQQGLISIVHDGIRRRKNAGDHNAGGGKNLADEAILHHALGCCLAPNLADDVCAEKCDGVGDGTAAQGQLDGADMQAGGNGACAGHVGNDNADCKQRNQDHQVLVCLFHFCSYSCEPTARVYFCLQMVAHRLALAP